MSLYSSQRMLLSILSAYMFIYLVMPFILYAFVRWRDSRSPNPDPQLGYKFGLNLINLVSIQIILGTGFFIISVLLTSMTKKYFDWNSFRHAIGFLIPAIIVLVVARVTIANSNQSTHPGVGRFFDGINWLITSISTIVILFAFFQAIVAKRTPTETFTVMLPGIIIYGIAAYLFGLQVRNASKAAG